jgi:hypothetical protein
VIEYAAEPSEEAVWHCCVVVRAVRPWPGTGLWWEAGQAHALPEAPKPLEPWPFVTEAARNEVVGVGTAGIREMGDR